MGETSLDFIGRMSPPVLGYWVSKWLIDPWTQDRADLRAAQVAQLVATAHLKKTAGGPWRVTDFMPYHRAAEPEDGGVSLSKAIRAAFGGGASPITHHPSRGFE